jgi:four helix bundle protein
MTHPNAATAQAIHTVYDLEERTLAFAKQVIGLCKALPNNTVNFKLIDQLVRSAGSVGANYREGNDALGKKDFIMRIKISRKEAKETEFWLLLVASANPEHAADCDPLVREVIELRKILSAIINKGERP